MVKYLETNNKNEIPITNIVKDLSQKLRLKHLENSDEICSSPLSVILCSLMMYPGMDNNTKKQFQDTFLTNHQIYHEDCQKLFDDVQDMLYNIILSSTQCELNIDNNLYLDQEFDVKYEFKNMISVFATMQKLNFELS